MTNFTEIKTPNGKALKFRLGGDSGGEQRWWRTQLTPKLLAATDKKSCPMISGWNGGVQRFIFVDFDGKTLEQQTLAEELCLGAAERYENCFAFRSVSGNWRAAFLVTSYGVPTTAQAVAYLESKLPESGHWFDHKGLSRLFVNASVVAQMQAGIARLGAAEPLPAKVQREVKPILNTLGKPHTYFSADPSQIPTANNFEGNLAWHTPEDTHHKLLCILTATWHLASDKGFNLPLAKLSEQLDCSPMQVSRMLKELCQLGLLDCIDHTYAQGRKAKTYKAKAALWRAIQQHKAKHLENSKPSPTTVTHIKDGQFYPLALSLLRHYSTEAEYLQKLSSLQNITPARLREGSKYFRYHLKTQAAQGAYA